MPFGKYMLYRGLRGALACPIRNLSLRPRIEAKERLQRGEEFGVTFGHLARALKKIFDRDGKKFGWIGRSIIAKHGAAMSNPPHFLPHEIPPRNR